MVDVLDREQCNVMIGFDIVNLRLLRTLELRGRSSPVEKMQVTSAGAYDELTTRGVHAVMCYALTEASNFVTTSLPGDDESERHSNGVPFPGVELRICDETTGLAVPEGKPGEICFRGWNQMLGYYNNAERTRAAFDEDGFLHTGDYGWVDAGGRLYYRGRFAMMIKTGGENVSEIEVEEFLTSQIPGVVNAAVVGAPNEEWGEMVVAFVETSETFSAEEIRQSCRDRLSRYKIPKLVFEVKQGQWPLTPTGKLQKDILRERGVALTKQMSSM